MSFLQLSLIRIAFNLILNWINSTKNNDHLRNVIGVIVGDMKADAIMAILTDDSESAVHRV